MLETHTEREKSTMKRLGSIILLLSLIATLLAGCGATPTPTPLPAKPTPIPATATPAAFPAVITDASNRKVTIKAAPQRIVSLSPSITEDLFAVGAGDQVVGVTTYCNYPAEAAKKEKIGGYSAKTISIEKIVALKPDLVIAESGIHNDVITALDPLGVTVLALKPVKIDEVYATLELLGRLTGHPDKAAATIADMKARIKAVSDKVATLPREKRLTVFWEIWDEPIMTAGPGTFPGQILELAGGVNLFADVTKDWPEVSAEEVIKRNPAVIMGPDTHADKLTPESIAKRPGWGSVAAAVNKRIHLINGDTSSRPSPRLALALEETAKALYPDLFK
jgi:iron complex transport system substrate-binding protein